MINAEEPYSMGKIFLESDIDETEVFLTESMSDGEHCPFCQEHWLDCDCNEGDSYEIENISEADTSEYCQSLN